MGTDTFQELKLSHLEFEPDSKKTHSQNVSQFPLPDELPKRPDLSHLPKDILKTTTVENLISQNEDLMSRLKVSLRRLSILENENQRIMEESSQSRMAQSSTTDQILVLKEKDNRWKQKVEILENQKEIQTEQIQELEQKLQFMSLDLVRHEKYHERIKNQVKPYITQLKAYANTQELKIQELEESLSQKEAHLRDIRNQIIEVTKNSQIQIDSTEKRSQEITQYYENQIQALAKELEIFREHNQDLELKSLKLHSALEKQDVLENEVINLTRSKEDLKDRLLNEIHHIQERQTELTRQNQKIGVEHADLQIRVLADYDKIQKLELENRQQQEQLEGLRFMWSSKNEENEKLKLAASALERLNVELSQKLNEIRK